MNKEFRTPFYGTVPTSSLPASNITYDNSDSGIDATNVQDAIIETIEKIDAKIPDAPESDGTYKLICTVADGVATYTWEA